MTREPALLSGAHGHKLTYRKFSNLEIKQAVLVAPTLRRNFELDDL